MSINIESLAIGDELLDGRITDTNAVHLAKKVREHGIGLTRMSAVSDTVVDIIDALDAAARRGRAAATEVFIVCSGGLGPTEDDRTREAAAAWAGVELVHRPELLKAIEARFASAGRAMTPNNAAQAMIPDGAEVLKNDVGSAPAFCVRKGDATAFFLPGVPREYRWLLEHEVFGRVFEGEGGGLVQHRRVLSFFGCGESELAHLIEQGGVDIEGSGVSVGYRPHFPTLDVTLTRFAEPGDDAVDKLASAILGAVGYYLVGEDGESLSGRVGRLLAERGQSVTTAESCTGGMVAQMITDVAGSSRYFDMAHVTYSNASKTALVDVPEQVLIAHGAVSLHTIVAMARGAADRAGATYGLATSGVAGPGGGSPHKPVGTVFVAVATPDGVIARRLSLGERWGRTRIREASAYYVLAMLLRVLEGRGADLEPAGGFRAPRFGPFASHEDVQVEP